MNETELQERFSNFLVKEKGFPESSLLKEMISGTDYRKNEVDLILVDLESSEIIGAVLFKRNSNINIKNDLKSKIDSLKKQLGLLSLPFYLVYPKDSEIAISAWSGGMWIELNFKNFPSYDSLRTINKVDKHKRYEAKKNILEDKYVRNKKSQYKFSKWLIYSVALGLVASLLIYLNQSNNQSAEITNLTKQISVLETKIENYQKNYEANKGVLDTVKYIDDSQAFEGLEKRMDVLEEGLLATPEKFLDYRRLGLEIYLNRSALEFQNGKIEYSTTYLTDKINTLQGMVWGLILTFISSILGFFLFIVKEKNKGSNDIV